MHAEARAVDAHPDDSHRAVRSWWEEMCVVTPDTGFQDGFVPTEMGHEDIAGDAPCALGHRKFGGAWRAGKTTSQLVVLVEFNKPLGAVQD